MTTNSTTNAILASVSYADVDMSDIKLSVNRSRKGRPQIQSVELSGLRAEPSDRFMHSLLHTCKLHHSIFRVFDSFEVLERVSQRNIARNLRVAVEVDPDGRRRVLGVSRPSTPIISIDQVLELAQRLNSQINHIAYEDGVAQIWHAPLALMNASFDIFGDFHSYRCLTEIPVDGVGQPENYLGFERQVCSNGAVAFHSAFRSTIPLGKRPEQNPIPALARFMQAFQDEAGYVSLRQRLESARKTPASLRESFSLKMLLDRDNARSLHRRTGTSTTAPSDIEVAFDNMAGRIEDLYGVASIDAISPRRQALSPTKAMVSDLVHFGTELATHRASPTVARRLHAWVGSLICGEYDLEGAPTNRREPIARYLTSN